MTDISAEISGAKLETCVFNAAGPNDVTLEELETISKTKNSTKTNKT